MASEDAFLVRSESSRVTTLQLGPALSAGRWTRRQHGVRLRRRGVVLRRRRRPDSLPRHGLIVCGGVTSRCILLLASISPSLCFNIQCAHSMSDITDDRATTSSVFVKLRDPTPPTRRLCFSGPSSFLPTSFRLSLCGLSSLETIRPTALPNRSRRYSSAPRLTPNSNVQPIIWPCPLAAAPKQFHGAAESTSAAGKIISPPCVIK